MEKHSIFLIKVTDDDIVNGTFIIPDEIVYIADEAFKNCKFLKHINIPKNVTGIGYSAFEDCVNLKSIDMSDEIRNIGKSAFRNCTSLTNITIPKSVKTIEEGIFYNCKSLKNINIMGDLKGIKEHAFYNCKSLKKLFIPKSIRYINASAFYGCSKLNLNIETSLFSFVVGYYDSDMIAFKKLHIYNDCITYKQALIYYDDFSMKCLRDCMDFYDYIITFLNSVRKKELYNIIKYKLTHNIIKSANIENFKYLKYKEHEAFIVDLLEKGIMQFDYMTEIDNYVNRYIKACVPTSNALISNKFVDDNIKSIDTSEKIENEIITDDIINSNNVRTL